MRLRVLAIVGLLLLSLSQGAWAIRKTDVVTLYNGDRITGEIKSLHSGALQFNTDALGNIIIDWQEIASVRSNYNYEFRLSSGERYYGTMHQPARPGELQITGIQGNHTVAWLEIVEIRPVEKNVKDRFDVYLSSGFSYNKASGVKQTNLNTDISYDTEKTINRLNGRHIITVTDEEVTSSTKVDLSRSIWNDRNSYFRTLAVSYENNDQLDLQHRYTVGYGLGQHFMDTHKARLTATVGLQALTEQNVSGGEQQSVEGVLAGEYSAWRLSTPKLDIAFSLSLYPSITESNRLRGDTDLRLRWEIVEDLYWDTTAYGTYDSNSSSNDEFDYGITLGVGWEY